MSQHGYVTVGHNIYEHNVVAERALGYPLPKGAVVHHVNTIRSDNRPCNLVICDSHKYHKLLHVRMRVVAAGGDPNLDKICTTCKLVRRRIEFGVERRSFDGLNNRCKQCVIVLSERRRRAQGKSVMKSNRAVIETLLHRFRPHVTHCPVGHEYSDNNTRLKLHKGRVQRACKACDREYARRRRLHVAV